jgi:hypothetical protein
MPSGPNRGLLPVSEALFGKTGCKDEVFFHETKGWQSRLYL